MTDRLQGGAAPVLGDADPVPGGGDPVVSLRGASFGFGDRLVVEEVTLQVSRGEVVALLGPNGSGKSTLVQGLLGLAEHQGGEVELFGVPLQRFRERTRVGYVPQRHSLSTSVRATVREIVATGRLPLRPWWRPASREDARVVDRAVEAVGLADRAREEVASLSGGQQRRVLIARALAAEPEVLLMDEPTAGVDTANQEALAAVLSRLAAAGTTMVVVTHELAALRGVATRIVCLDRGRLDFDGPPERYAAHTDHPPGTGHHHDAHDHPDVPTPSQPGGLADRPPLLVGAPLERAVRRGAARRRAGGSHG